MAETYTSKNKLVIMALARILMAVPIMAALFFLPAGTLAYWEAWVYIAVILIPTFIIMIYLLKNYPDLLERRMRTKEKETEQKLFITISGICLILALLIPGFDKRMGWSNVPTFVVILADFLVLIAYGIIVIVYRENRFVSRTIEVEQEQKVISSGPYAIIRHPMYTGILITYIFSPLALGSYWAVIPALITIIPIVARIHNEEKILARDLEGYQEYMQKTRYRLIPRIW